ncbi:6-phosphofructokinase 1 [Fistulifera solaris]|uniref:6-phosphofructokinase 1 n=1 Tax=Fistulifera solaris TaxID=1519565 RepID=A0A1Z5JIM4_FISSO|nr:6-phosphofructokinase 1 [Fistulifera solaris]|eukprot:GAX13692.1 6-phosphofructokinase 1 [Fistulifera solaris]
MLSGKNKYTLQASSLQEDTVSRDEELAEIEQQLESAGFQARCEEHLIVKKVYKAKLESLRDRFPSTDTLNSRVELFKPIPMQPPKAFQNQTEVDVARNSNHSSVSSNPNSFSQFIAFDYNEYFNDDDVVYLDAVRTSRMVSLSRAFVRAGPRERLHFNPATVNAAIVTCGGLCPGLNNVIRELTHSLYSVYGVNQVWGIRGGFRGFLGLADFEPIILTNELVEDIHHEGGTVLRSGRGGFEIEKILQFLQERDISQLYVIGGDGTHRAAFKIHEECMQQNRNIAVVGICKTIDNDLDYIDRSFGFLSSVEAAQASIRTAKTESMCVSPRGITVVKLMGRSAGYLTAYAALGSGDVDCVLIPEVPIVLEGKEGILHFLEKRVAEKKYAVVVVAEGAGEEILGTSSEIDKGGNKKLQPIGEYIKKQIQDHFENKGLECTVRYIDPSYMVRSVPANAADSVYCTELAQNAVHGAMCGYTGFSVGQVNSHGVYIPIPLLVATSPRTMDPKGLLWERILSLTGQPNPDVGELCNPENEMDCFPHFERFIH